MPSKEFKELVDRLDLSGDDCRFLVVGNLLKLITQVIMKPRYYFLHSMQNESGRVTSLIDNERDQEVPTLITNSDNETIDATYMMR